MIGIPISALLHGLVVIILSFRILYRRLSVNTTLAWIVVLSALPFVGVILYFMFGDHRMGRRRLKLGPRIRQFYQKSYSIDAEDVPSENMNVSNFFEDLSNVVAHDSGFHPSMGNRILLFQEGEDILSRMKSDIDNAKANCFLEFYIIDAQGAVIPVLEALEAAAKRGVDCRILADDVGSNQFFKDPWCIRLQAAGVRVERSLPIGIIKSLSKRSDLRNHRKIVVIDQAIGYVGSFNLIDPTAFKREKNVGQWVDIMLRVEGHIVSSLACVFNTDFIFDSVGADFAAHDLKKMPTYAVSEEFSRDVVMQLIPSGPEMRTSLIYEVIVSAIFGARKKILIVTPYFVPDEALLMAMGFAARRGLDVTLVLPRYIDSRLARYAGQAVFGSLLRSGVKIARYQGGMLHTKAIVIDDDISFVGTVNMDMRSFYLNLEVTLAIYDPRFNQQLSRVVTEYLDDSEYIDQEYWDERSMYIRLKENIFRLATPLL